MPAPAAAPPHAYVVEARPFDGCRPPACALATAAVSGIAEGRRAGAYVARSDAATELSTRRGVTLAPGEAFSFRLPPSDARSRVDVAMGDARREGGAFRATLRVDDEAGHALVARAVVGASTAWSRTTPLAQRGRDEEWMTAVREELPARDARALVVSLRNDGDAPLSLAAPLVAYRVEGRAPRQVVLVFFDAVPHPAMSALFAGRADARSAASTLAGAGTTFTLGVSPGQLTGSFVRRFFKARFFALDGDPSLAGQGFDEAPPARAEGPIARLAEQGFVTTAIASNLYLSPALSRIGFDEGYDIESTLDLQDHPPLLVRRFAAWVDAHADQDFAAVVWFASTHAPWRDVRADLAPLSVPWLADDAVDRAVLDPVWRNLVDTSAALSSMLARTRQAPPAHRVWLVATDHGHTFSRDARERPWRLPHESVARGHMHCCLATDEEARTPFVLAEERPDAPPPVPSTVASPASTMLAWRRVERAFGVDLDLPDTSTFREPDEVAAAFDDGVTVSVGDSGAIAAFRGALAYRSYRPRLDLDPIWSVSAPVARMLAGTPRPTACALAEELYDTGDDPTASHDLACARWGDLLDLRARVAAWTSEWADPSPHVRSRHRLVFAAPTTLTLTAPRGYALALDGGAPTSRPAPTTATATTFQLEDEGAPLGVVDLRGPDVTTGLIVRCAASGLPVANLDAAHPRLDLALASANCPGEPPAGTPAPGEAWLSTTATTQPREGAAPPTTPEALTDALRRWGYVR